MSIEKNQKAHVEKIFEDMFSSIYIKQVLGTRENSIFLPNQQGVFVYDEIPNESSLEKLEGLNRETILDIIRAYPLRRPESIEDLIRFIENNPSVIRILLEAPEEIGKVFGNVPLELDISMDPEEGTESIEIIINVGDRTVEEVKRLYKRLFEEWIIDWIDEFIDKVVILEKFS